MNRHITTPRRDWERTTLNQGLTYSKLPDGSQYWNESAFYSLSSKDVEHLETTTETLQRMCIAAGQYICENSRWKDFGIPSDAASLIRQAWIEEPPAIYGRFDLAYTGQGPAKLLEYNADTPTALVEAAVIQWYWLQDCFPSKDQFNSIHEKLVEKWRDLKNYVTVPLFFAHLDTEEDTMTVCYLRQTAEEAGIRTKGILMPQVGWANSIRKFVGLENEEIGSIFKLYPWEMLVREPFWRHIVEQYPKPSWIEPIWKMMFSNKALLAVLWEMYPGHPNLLPCYLGGPRDLKSFVQKPLLGREGANVRMVEAGNVIAETDGPYARDGFVYQERANSRLDGKFITIGSWHIADQGSAGIGIRESDKAVVGNLSQFVPHVID